MEFEKECVNFGEEPRDRITLLHPGTRSCRSLILSLIFSLLTCNEMEVKLTCEAKANTRAVTAIAYSLCKAVTVGCLPSLGSDMNVIFASFILQFALIFLCRLSWYISLLLCFNILQDDRPNCYGLRISKLASNIWKMRKVKNPYLIAS